MNASHGYITDGANTGDREYMSAFYRYTKFRPPLEKPAGDVIADRAVEILGNIGYGVKGRSAVKTLIANGVPRSRVVTMIGRLCTPSSFQVPPFPKAPPASRSGLPDGRSRRSRSRICSWRT